MGGRSMARILIVDDQPHLEDLFSGQLVDEGHQVVCMGDAESVRKCLDSTLPDIVLLDLYLKGFEGWELLRDIKNWNPNLPVLIVTAYDSFTDDPRVSQADGYIVKSFTHLDEIKEKIQSILFRQPAVWIRQRTEKQQGIDG
jgi:two-component system response regulator (stage 0 sporulation protein F)